MAILAYNEADNIEKMIEHLISQSFFNQINQNFQVEIIVVANGCTDNTASKAEKKLSVIESLHKSKFTWKVINLEESGKSNAWNELIHRFSNQNTDFYVLMDADIEFCHERTVLNTVDCLMKSPQAEVAVDIPLKRVSTSSPFSIFNKLSLKFSNQRIKEEKHLGICGQFYCARGSTLRSIWMPKGLSVDDGFLLAMVTTNCFRYPVDESKVVTAKDASHYYDAKNGLIATIHHQARIIIGTVLNCYLCWDLLFFITPEKGTGAGMLIKDLNTQKPNWYNDLMNNAIKAHGPWLIQNSILFRSFKKLSGKSFVKKIIRLPLTFAEFGFDIVTCWIANWKLIRGNGIGFW